MKSLLAIVITLASAFISVAAPIEKAAEELDMREATFRYQFSNNASAQQQHAAIYYLLISGKDGKRADPPLEFMNRFAENKPPVKAASERKCTRE